MTDIAPVAPRRQRRPRKDDVGYVVRSFPVTLKRRIAAAADARDVSFNDVAVEALADAFGVAWAPTGRKSRGVGDSAYVELRMPRPLRKRINELAARREVPGYKIILRTLSERYDRP